jgi:hypothetical protein
VAQRNFIGAASVTVAQVDKFTPVVVESTDDFILTLTLDNSSTIVVTFTATAATVANVTAGLTAAWNADPIASLWATAADVTTYMTLTATSAGVPFSVAASTLDHGGANTQTLTKVSVTANKGPLAFNTKSNWAEGIVPVAGDDITLISGQWAYELLQSAIVTGKFFVAKTYTKGIGLPGYRASIAPTSFVAEGSGTSAWFINFNAANIPLLINSTPTPTSGFGLDLIGSNLTTVTINSGNVGIAINAGDTATVATVNLVNGSCTCGIGVTLTSFLQSNGTGVFRCNVTNASVDSGTLSSQGTATITTARVSGGTFVANSSGTITTLNVVDGTCDFNQSRIARTVASTNWSGGNILADSNVITFTNGIQPSGILSLTAKAA